MRLKILLPARVLLDEPVTAVRTASPEGSFMLLPNHVDFASSLSPGILSFRPAEPGENQKNDRYAAIGRGILVKRGESILVATRQGVLGDDLAALHETVRRSFARQTGRERDMQTTLARLESSFIQRFVEIDRP